MRKVEPGDIITEEGFFYTLEEHQRTLKENGILDNIETEDLFFLDPELSRNQDDPQFLRTRITNNLNTMKGLERESPEYQRLKQENIWIKSKAKRLTNKILNKYGG